MAAGVDLPQEPGQHAADLTRFALHVRGQHQHLEAHRRGRPSGSLTRQQVAADHRDNCPLEHGVAWLGGIGDAAGQAGPYPLDHAGRDEVPQRVTVEDGRGVGKGRGVGYRRARSDGIERIADDVAEHQRDKLGWRGQTRQTTAFDTVQVLADDIDLVDRRAAAQQGVGRPLQVLDRDAIGGQRQ